MMIDVGGEGSVGWALQAVRTGLIGLHSICDSEASAYALLREQQLHQAHRGKHVVVPVTITITLAIAGKKGSVIACTSER